MRQLISCCWFGGLVALFAAGSVGCSDVDISTGGPLPESSLADTSSAITENTTQNELDEEVVPDGVVNYTRIDATVACAGATPPEAMAGLKELGFAAVINFRTVEERGATVDRGWAAAEAAGLRYYHIPFREATAQVAETFLKTVADPLNQPMYIHCGSANRVGAMWMIKRVKLDGWSIDDALEEAEIIGLRSQGLREFALEYLEHGS